MKILCLGLVSFSDALRNGVRIIGGHDADENWFHEEILKHNRTLKSEWKTLINQSRPGVGIRAARPGPIFFSPSRAGPICFQPDRAEKAEPDPGPIGIGLARSSPIM